MTGIPLEKLEEGEREKLLHLEDVLHERVVGQDEAVKKVSEAIIRARAGIANPNSSKQVVGFMIVILKDGSNMLTMAISLLKLFLPVICYLK